MFLRLFLYVLYLKLDVAAIMVRDSGTGVRVRVKFPIATSFLVAVSRTTSDLLRTTVP